MAGVPLPQEEVDLSQPTRPAETVSDDDRSVAADSWSIKSEYGSTLDDEQRHADAAEALSSASHLRAASEYSSDKEEEDADADEEGETSVLGLQSYWDSAYAGELTNFRDHGDAGEIWFGADVMDTVVSWTKNLCLDISRGCMPNQIDDNKPEPDEQDKSHLSSWSVLDIGTGNGLLLQELAKQGFSDLTGTDYSEGAIELARSIADRDGFSNIKFLVDDILDTKLERQFKLVMDKGTLDAIGLHPDGAVKKIMYWDSVYKLLVPGGLLVITSCNNTKDELVEQVENFNCRQTSMLSDEASLTNDQETATDSPLQYISHVRTYPTFMFGGSVGSRVATVAFLRN